MEDPAEEEDVEEVAGRRGGGGRGEGRSGAGGRGRAGSSCVCRGGGRVERRRGREEEKE